VYLVVEVRPRLQVDKQIKLDALPRQAVPIPIAHSHLYPSSHAATSKTAAHPGQVSVSLALDRRVEKVQPHLRNLLRHHRVSDKLRYQPSR